MICWGSDAIVRQKNFVGSFQRLKAHRRLLIERVRCQTGVSDTTIKKHEPELPGRLEDDHTLPNGILLQVKSAVGKRRMTILEQ
ncbi:hypothetical protein WT21_18545 [Burkholderia territorii]|nr:hypothetical protein WT21_18545 [Burkholderia territorii]